MPSLKGKVIVYVVMPSSDGGSVCGHTFSCGEVVYEVMPSPAGGSVCGHAFPLGVEYVDMPSTSGR